MTMTLTEVSDFLWACTYAETMFLRGDVSEKRVINSRDLQRVSIIDNYGYEVTLYPMGKSRAPAKVYY